MHSVHLAVAPSELNWASSVVVMLPLYSKYISHHAMACPCVCVCVHVCVCVCLCVGVYACVGVMLTKRPVEMNQN